MNQLVLSIFALLIATVCADDTGVYRNEPHAIQEYTDWMAKLPDRFLLSDLSLPGTHDSAAYTYGGETTVTKSMNIEEQLKAGIRAFDIRLGVNHLNAGAECQGPDLWTFHGISCQFESFSDILSSVDAFLDDHGDEMIVMRVKKENGDISDFATLVEADMDARPNLFFKGKSTNPTLGETRGKIVLLRDYGGSSRGISWSNFLDIQDEYSMSNNWDLARKWKLVKQHFIDTDKDPYSRIYVNFLSASGGGFPYFFASGKSSWESYAPALLTGWTEAGFWPFNSCGNDDLCIDEYYRVSCAFGVYSVAFKGVNIMAHEFLASSKPDRTGIVFADFPGPNLIESIIAIN